MKYKSIALPKPSQGESFEGQVSLVRPDETMSLEEILLRFSKGESLDIGQKFFYPDTEDEIDYEKMHRMDLVEIEEIKRGTQEYIEEYNRITKEQKERESVQPQAATEGGADNNP